MNRRTGVMAILVVVVVIVVALAGYLLINQTRSYTINELVENGTIGGTELESGTEYSVRDEVTKTSTFRLPKVLQDMSVDSNSMTTYTSVWFKSYPDDPIPFVGDRTQEFAVGETVTFSLDVKEYSTVGLPPFTAVEPTYVSILLQDVGSAIFNGNWYFVNFNASSIDGQNWTLAVTELNQAYPSPISWSTITIRAQNETDVWIDLPSIELRSPVDDLLGFVGKERNSSLVFQVEVGQRLELEYNVTQNGQLFLRIQAKLEMFPYESFYVATANLK